MNWYTNNVWRLFLSLSTLWTIVGNLTVILLIRVDPQLKQPRNLLISSLAATDLIVGLVIMPIQGIINPPQPGQWTYGIIPCRLFFFIQIVTCHASMYHLLMIAYDCYQSVTSAAYFQLRTRRRMKTMIAICWIVPILHTFPIFFVNVDQRQLDIRQQCCTEHNPQTTMAGMVIGLFGFWLPAVALLVFYYRIWKVSSYAMKLSFVVSMPKRVNIYDLLSFKSQAARESVIRRANNRKINQIQLEDKSSRSEPDDQNSSTLSDRTASLSEGDIETAQSKARTSETKAQSKDTPVRYGLIMLKLVH